MNASESRTTMGVVPRTENAAWTPRAGLAIRIVGAGAYIPPHTVTTNEIARAFPGWPSDKILEKTGIVERRYLWPLDVDQGRTIPRMQVEAGSPAVLTATDMGEVALTYALRMADVAARQLDVLVVVTCTPDQPRFSHDAMELQHRLGMRKDAHCFVMDSGCGGSLYMLDLVARMMDSGGVRTAAIVGTNFTSPMVDRALYGLEGPTGEDGKAISPYLTMYVFGDGAGAVVVRLDTGDSLGIRASIIGNGSEDLVRCPGGGALSPAYGDRYRALDHAYIVNGKLVASTYLHTMPRCMEIVAREVDCPFNRVARFYLHQPNDRLLRALAQRLELREDQLASNVARVGNTSSAGMFMLLADDLAQGRVTLGSATPSVFAAIGAGVHYGAQFVLL
jgi:3-oxoacyl-[acyl-carrier-protein] synthase III